MAPSFYLVTPWYGAFAGGAVRTFATLAQKLDQCGYAVTVLTTCSASPYQDWWRAVLPAGEQTMDGVRVHRFPVDQTDPALYHAAVRAQAEGRRVSKELQEGFFRFGINSQALVRHVAGLPGDAVVIAGHYFQSLVPTLINELPGRIVALPAFHDEPEFTWAPVGRLINNARTLLFLSEQEKDLAIRTYGRVAGRRLVESPVVGLGVDMPPGVSTLLADAGHRSRVAERFCLPSRYLVYVGRLEAGKGLTTLCPWVIRLNERRAAAGEVPLPLVLIGEGPPGVLPDSPFIMPLGYLADDDKFSVMAQALALVNPSLLESFSYVVMEAWLAGIPVLVPAACEVTAAHVEDSGGGLRYSDEAHFAAHVDTLLAPGSAAHLAAAGQRYVTGRMGWGEVMDRLLRAVLP